MTTPAPEDPWRAGMRITAERLRLSPGMLLFYAELHSPSQTISSTSSGAASDAIAWETPAVDWLGGWDSGTPTRYTVPYDGWYMLTGTLALESASDSTRGAAWYINGSATAAGSARYNVAGSAERSSMQARTVPMQLTAGDYVELVPYQDSGSGVDTSTGAYRQHIGIYWASPS